MSKDYLILRNNKTGETTRLVPVVMLINTKHDDGTFRNTTRIKDDQTIDLGGGEEFVICYVDEKMTLPHK